MRGSIARAASPAVMPLLFVLLWSSAFVAVGAGITDVSPLLFLTLRLLLAALVLVVFIEARMGHAAWRGVPFGPLIIGGIMINGLYLGGAFIAMKDLTAGTMALIGAFQPAATAVLGQVLLKERMRPIQWLGIAVGLGGVLVAVGPGSAAAAAPGSALIFAVAAVACLALGTVFHRRYCRDAPVVQANAVQLGAAGLFTLAAASIGEEMSVTPSPTFVASLLYLSLIVSIGAMALFILLLRRGSAGQVASNFYLTPGLTALLGWLVLGQGLRWWEILGLAVASVGVWLANRRPGR